MSTISLMRSISRSTTKVFSQGWLIPTFLCPWLLRLPSAADNGRCAHNATALGRIPGLYRRFHNHTISNPYEKHTLQQSGFSALPWTCPGCGAYTQTGEPDEAGFYTTSRKAVTAFIAAQKNKEIGITEEEVFDQVVRKADSGILESLGLGNASHLEAGPSRRTDRTPQSFHPKSKRASPESALTPVCDRCHYLLFHHKGASIIHPSIESIQDIISDSPHRYNHIYHVIDAADFPLSLIPQLQQHLSLSPQRSQNRRANKSKFHHGRKAEMSFVVTRSDLLAPTKKQVDSMMPYLIEVLRDALGLFGKDVRLGNVRCVSSERGWWTKKLKEDIWERGGGGWMVGKVNVGKSKLFETVFPKGRDMNINFRDLRKEASRADGMLQSEAHTSQLGPYRTERFDQRGLPVRESDSLLEGEEIQGESLLPPAPKEVDFPVMPIVSSLPGTTASPIRLPFGKGKGELIDLPGLDRGGLEKFVSEEHQSRLVMRQRIKAEQHTVKPGQSILVGGLIRITPTGSDTILLACPFVPFDSHVTNTEKAVAIQMQEEPSGLSSIAAKGSGKEMASAGIFELRWDVTKQRSGPLTAPAAVGLKTKVLPFIIYSADILIEGCGWIELAVQVRKRNRQVSEAENEAGHDATVFPSVEVFSPEGKHVGVRRPMSAWVHGGHHPVRGRSATKRPRRSMKGMKKTLKKTLKVIALAG